MTFDAPLKKQVKQCAVKKVWQYVVDLDVRQKWLKKSDKIYEWSLSWFGDFSSSFQ